MAGPLDYLGGILGIGTAISGLGASSAQKRALQAQTRLLNMQGDTYQQNMPEIVRRLQGIIRDPRTPAYTANQRQAESDANAYYQQAAGDVNRQFSRSGGPGNSSAGVGAATRVATNRAQALTQSRVGQLGELENRRAQALQTLLGSVTGMGNSALSGYGQQAGVYGQQAAGAGQGLMQLLEALQMMQYRPATPGGGTPSMNRVESDPLAELLEQLRMRLAGAPDPDNNHPGRGGGVW